MTPPSDKSSDPDAQVDTHADTISAELDIVNERGLHARASAKFVKCAKEFEAKITVSREDQTVLATSIMGLMMLAAGIGTQIEVTATGVQAEEAIRALSELVADKFGEST